MVLSSYLCVVSCYGSPCTEWSPDSLHFDMRAQCCVCVRFGCWESWSLRSQGALQSPCTREFSAVLQVFAVWVFCLAFPDTGQACSKPSMLIELNKLQCLSHLKSWSYHNLSIHTSNHLFQWPLYTSSCSMSTKDRERNNGLNVWNEKDRM